MKSDTSFKGFEINDLVEYSPIGNSTYEWSRRTEGIIVGIEMMRFNEDAWFTIEQVGNMQDSTCNLEKNYYIIGRCTKIGYGKTFRDLKTIKLIKRRARMNTIIIEMFPVTKEAVLVDKWFGREIDKPIFKMLIAGKEKALLKEAQKLEKENKKP